MNRKKIGYYIGILMFVLCIAGCGAPNAENQITQMDHNIIKDAKTSAPKTTEQTSQKSEKSESGNKKEKNLSMPSPSNCSLSTAPTGTPQKNVKKTMVSKDNKKRKKKASPSSIKKNNSQNKKTQSSTKKEEIKNTPKPNKEDSPYCVISIECKTILQNKEKLNESKKDFVPANGVILSNTKVKLKANDTVYDILYRVCKEKKIQLDAKYTPAYGTYYVQGIHQLYEFDCGDLSGWNYEVNGQIPNYGYSKYKVNPNDVIKWRYTCDLGKDLKE